MAKAKIRKVSINYLIVNPNYITMNHNLKSGSNIAILINYYITIQGVPETQLTSVQELMIL